LDKLKLKILQRKINVADYEFYKDIDNPVNPLYIAFKHNSTFQVTATGLLLQRL
jgi:hypothetical protein